MASGTYTIKSSGGDYTSLSNWEAGEQANLTGTGPCIAECYAMEDTTAVTIDGWTTTADDYIKIYTPSSERHDGKWNTAKARLYVSDEIPLTVREQYLRLDGLQIANHSPSASARHLISILLGAGSGQLYISNCILRGHGSGTYTQTGVLHGTTATDLKMWNSLVYGLGTASAYGNQGVDWASGTVDIYSCVFIAGYLGIYNHGATLTCKNCYAKAGAQAFYDVSTMVTCASSDTSGSSGLQNIPYSTATFVNVTADSEDLHLAGTGSALYHTGTDTSGDAAPLNFTTDIDGNAYYDTGGARSIGADEYVAAVSGNPWWYYAQQ